MRAVVQRVLKASVKVSSKEISSIGRGFLVLLGVKSGDNEQDIDYVVRKIAGLRIFNDDCGKMNLSIDDLAIRGEILAVSQFTLLGDVRKGRRPSFIEAEAPEKAENLFMQFTNALTELSIPVKTGQFGAMMEVSLINDGPVTILIDSEVMPGDSRRSH